MARFDWSVTSSVLLTEELTGDNREKGTLGIRKKVNEWTVGFLVRYAFQRNLNTYCYIMALRDRVARYEIRRIFGNDAAAWNVARDEEPFESLLDSTHETPLEPANRVEPLPLVTLPVINISAASEGEQSNENPRRDLIEEPRRAEASIERPNAFPPCPDSLLPTGQSYGRYRDPISFGMTEPTTYSQSHLGVSEVATGGSIGNQENTHVSQPLEPLENMESATRQEERRVENNQASYNPQTQSTRYQISPIPLTTTHADESDRSLDLTAPLAPARNTISRTSVPLDYSAHFSKNLPSTQPCDETSYYPMVRMVATEVPSRTGPPIYVNSTGFSSNHEHTSSQASAQAWRSSTFLPSVATAFAPVATVTRHQEITGVTPAYPTLIPSSRPRVSFTGPYTECTPTVSSSSRKAQLSGYSRDSGYFSMYYSSQHPPLITSRDYVTNHQQYVPVTSSSTRIYGVTSEMPSSFPETRTPYPLDPHRAHFVENPPLASQNSCYSRIP